VPEVPTIDEIGKLPLRAIVAFAARCARRVQPLYQKTITLDRTKALNHAIEEAERFA